MGLLTGRGPRVAGMGVVWKTGIRRIFVLAV